MSYEISNRKQKFIHVKVQYRVTENPSNILKEFSLNEDLVHFLTSIYS